MRKVSAVAETAIWGLHPISAETGKADTPCASPPSNTENDRQHGQGCDDSDWVWHTGRPFWRRGRPVAVNVVLMPRAPRYTH
jgi:hypothetical protein